MTVRLAKSSDILPGATPHPIRCAERPVQPSPARGEGIAARAVLAARQHNGRHRITITDARCDALALCGRGLDGDAAVPIG
jgi:hypothetical protein